MGQQESQNTSTPLEVSKPKNGERFETLLSELTRLRPERGREELIELVKAKKSKVGGGFLTDQGALFLVASDLGVSLKPLISTTSFRPSTESKKDELDLTARMLSIGSPKIYKRKSDSIQGFLGRIVLYDSTSAMPVSIWNKDVFFRILEANFKPGDHVRVTGGYFRKGLEETQNSVSISDLGNVTKLEDLVSKANDLPPVAQKIIDVGQVSSSVPQGSILSVKGKIASAIRSSEFTRKDGTKSKYVSFSLVSVAGENQEEERKGQSPKQIRVVLWDNSNPIFENLQVGETVTLLSVRPKNSDFFGIKEIELHGDETTQTLEHWDQSMVWLESEYASVSKQLTKLNGSTTSVNDPNTQQQQKVSPFVARVLSNGHHKSTESTPSSSCHLLLIDSSKRKISLTALDDSSDEARELETDDVVVCKPDSFDEIGQKATCSKKGSLIRVKPERKDIPKAQSLVSQIDKLEPNSISSVDCMILSVSQARDIQTKEGLVKRSEATIADPTGEIKIYAWRGLTRRLETLSPGTRLMLNAVEVQSHEGKKFLVFKNYTSIETFSSS